MNMKENKLKRSKSIEILRFLALSIYQGKNYEVSPSDVLAFPLIWWFKTGKHIKQTKILCSLSFSH